MTAHTATTGYPVQSFPARGIPIYRYPIKHHTPHESSCANNFTHKCNQNNNKTFTIVMLSIF